MPTQTFQDIPLSDIVLSGDNQRQIDEKSQDFQELMASIAGGGVRVPIQVRVVPGKKDQLKYELRAGERRFRACKALGFETIPAVVYCDLEDPEALDLTYIENKFRQNLRPMEEAAEIALLMDRLGGDAKRIAKHIGKSEQWVRVRANIIGGLSKPWRAIFADLKKHPDFAGWTISHLLQIARLPEHLQADLYKEMTQYQGRAERETAVDLEEHIAKVMHLLSKAKWDLDDETLAPKAGPCSKCPKRTGHQPVLWFDSEDQVKAGDQCMDPVCYQGKQAAWVARQAKELQEKHPKLVLVAKEYLSDDVAVSLRDQVGSFLPNWDYSPATKNAKDAVPAMVVDGSAAGKLTYVKLKPQGGGSTSSRCGMGVSTPLKQRKMQLDAKRWAQVLVDLREALPDKTVANLTWKEKVTGLMAAVACFGNERLWHARTDVDLDKVHKLMKAKNGAAEALELLWNSFVPTLEKHLTWNGPVTQTLKNIIEEATWIADLVGLDAKKMFDEVCTRKGFTEPKSWKNLNADGTLKAEQKAKKVKTKQGCPQAAA